VPAQPTRGPQRHPAPAAEEPAAEEPAADEAAVEEPATPLPPAKRARTAKKAAPPKKAAPETAVTPVKAAKKASVKRAPAKIVTPEATPAAQQPATPAAAPEPQPAATPAAPELRAVAIGPEPVVRLKAVPTEPEPQHFESLVEHLLAEPARSPEILAAAAVRTLGPRARAWADRTRAAYPTADREALARLAVQRFVRSAGLRSGFGALAGPYTPIALATATVFTHAELVLHLAAVYGLDPEDPQRAGDLLKLASPGVGPVVAWVALSLVSRSLPGLGLLTAVLGARATADAVAVQARRYYAEYSSQVSHSSGRSS
jgi:uncharacterized protein (DUF697 family)